MSDQKYLNAWKVQEVLDTLPQEEHKEFLRYVLKKLKKFKLDNDTKLLIEKEGVKVSGLGFVVSLMTACMAGALSRETGDPSAVISAIGFGTAIASFIGFKKIDYDPENIKMREELSEDAKLQIKYLQAKIRRIDARSSK